MADAQLCPLPLTISATGTVQRNICVGQKRAPRTEEDVEGHNGQLRGARRVPHLPFLSLPTLLAEQRALNLMLSGMSRQFFKLILALLQVGSKEQ